MRTAVRFLDNVIDLSRFPLPQQRDEAQRARRIGLGLTGLADALAMLGIRYDADEVAAVTEAAADLGAVRGNAALIVHDRAGSEDDAVEELVRWGLQPEDRARKSLGFLTHPTWRAYIFCYTLGLPRCRAYVGTDLRRFERLLDEQLIPADLVAA